jgi:nitrogenase molybdenum-iron protein beta chain
MSELGAIHVTVGFPSYNRLILGDNYTGYAGGLRLLEDFITPFAGPL